MDGNLLLDMASLWTGSQIQTLLAVRASTAFAVLREKDSILFARSVKPSARDCEDLYLAQK